VGEDGQPLQGCPTPTFAGQPSPLLSPFLPLVLLLMSPLLPLVLLRMSSQLYRWVRQRRVYRFKEV
jgi:hypothetical protein